MLYDNVTQISIAFLKVETYLLVENLIAELIYKVRNRVWVFVVFGLEKHTYIAFLKWLNKNNALVGEFVSRSHQSRFFIELVAQFEEEFFPIYFGEESSSLEIGHDCFQSIEIKRPLVHAYELQHFLAAARTKSRQNFQSVTLSVNEMNNENNVIDVIHVSYATHVSNAMIASCSSDWSG